MGLNLNTTINIAQNCHFVKKKITTITTFNHGVTRITTEKELEIRELLCKEFVDKKTSV